MPDDSRDQAVPEILLSCGVALARLFGGADDRVDLEAVIADLYRLPAALPATGHLAAGLVVVLLRAPLDSGPQHLRHLERLVEIADLNPPPVLDWPRIRAAARALVVMRAGVERERADPSAALAEIEALSAMTADSPRVQALLKVQRAGLGWMQALQSGDHATLRRIPFDLQELRASIGEHHQAAAYLDALNDFFGLLAANERGDVVTMQETIERIRASAGRLPLGDYLRTVIDDGMAGLDTILPMMAGASPGGTFTPLSDDKLATIRADAQQPDMSNAERAFRHAFAGMAGSGFGQETDLGRVDAAVESFRRALTAAPADDPQRILYLQSLGFGLMRRAEVSGNSADLDEAVEVLTHARDLAGGPNHPLWAFISETLAIVRRRRGESPDARRLSLEGLRRYAWDVLLQEDPASAAAAVRDAAQLALDTAHSCLVDNAPADAIHALDACRGLVLFAATKFRAVTIRLDDAGRHDLSERWRAATASAGVEAAPLELRREVLTVLAGDTDPSTSGPAELLDPPTLLDIRSALARLDADALIYLMPGTPIGWAVMAAVEGPPSFMALPNLVLDDDVDIEQHLAVMSRRDLAFVGRAGGESGRDLDPQPSDSHFLGSLDTLCDWAWRAAVGPLLDRYLARLRKPPSGRPPRVVLVPMGNLARIPWQAARCGDGTYAVERVALSQAVSARMLCESAALPAVPVAPVGLIVGDPDTAGPASSLVAARTEAYAIHRAFYRGARYVGRRADGTVSRSGRGSVEEVREWLTTTRPGAGAMLHLACHGVVQPTVNDVTSYLLLAGGGKLAAEELVGVMTGAPVRAIGLAVLAACHTGVSGRGYDEAYSLGTAFLASGVRSVLSTQWSIPDGATSVLMFMFHHYLMDEGRTAWDALRQAQLWMLNPNRQPPKRMPPPLVQQLSDADPAQVVSWAGFVHWGQ